MALQVTSPSETPGIRWPVPPPASDPEPLVLPDPPRRRAPRRDDRNQRGTRLRWALLWISALAGGACSWLWLARQDESKVYVVAAETELRQLASMRQEFERASEIRPGNFRIYAESTARVAEVVSKTPVDSAVREAWSRELEYLKEANTDLEWMQQRMRQLEVIQGPMLTNEIQVNESTLRTGLNVLAEEPAGPGRHFRPGLARALRNDLDRRMSDVRAQAVFAPPPAAAAAKPPAAKPPLKSAAKPPQTAQVKPAEAPKAVKAIAKAGTPQKKARRVAVKSGVIAKKPPSPKAKRPTVAERLRAIRAERDRLPRR
jgi:hypothetical protein